jgi:hypothetical protein
VLLQTGAAYVSKERIYSLYRVILLEMDNAESRARRGKSWRKIPVALCVTEVKCLVNRSLGSSRRPRYRTCKNILLCLTETRKYFDVHRAVHSNIFL